jgi:PAS domain S-box-containing protein
MRVLLLEGEPAQRSLLRDVLVARGHVVSACGSEDEAWAAYGRHVPSLIVLDLDLPGLDGLAFCRRIRALPEGRRTVVVVLTDRTGLGNLAAVLDAGADDYLTKPFGLDRFSLRLQIAERRVGDLEERERQAAERLEGERLLRAVFGLGQVGMVLVDDQGRFVEVNPAALPLLGVAERAGLADRSLPEILDAGRSAVAAERWQDFLLEGTLTGEYRLNAADGTELVIEYAATARLLPNRHLCVLRDVTAYSRAEAERERTLADS